MSNLNKLWKLNDLHKKLLQFPNENRIIHFSNGDLKKAFLISRIIDCPNCKHAQDFTNKMQCPDEKLLTELCTVCIDGEYFKNLGGYIIDNTCHKANFVLCKNCLRIPDTIVLQQFEMDLISKTNLSYTVKEENELEYYLELNLSLLVYLESNKINYTLNCLFPI